MADPEIVVAEVFGPTIQGEGRMIGRRAWFVRTAGCDSRCEWCDTPYAQDPDAGEKLSATEIVGRLRELGLAPWEVAAGPRPCVVLTGGNPCIQPLEPLCRLLRQQLGCELVAETQGTVIPPWIDWLSHLVLSPKRHLMTKGASDWQFLCELARRVLSHESKVVLFDEEDYGFAKAVARYVPGPLTLQVGSRGGEPQNLGEWLERFAKDLDWPHQDIRILPQLHVLAWGNERGR